MDDLIATISDAASQLGVQIQIVPPEDISVIRERVIRLYCGGMGMPPLWEHMRESVGVHDALAWSSLPEMGNPGDIILWFEADRELAGLRFDTMASLKSVLGETHHFEFYVSDVQASYVFAFNHHDVLVADGEAGKWLLASLP